MAKLPSVEGVSIGSLNSDIDDLLAEYKMLAKRADQRMVRLERASNKSEYKGVLKMAYARAQHDLKAFTPKERLETGKPLRFNTAPIRKKSGEIDVPKMNKKMNVLKTFLRSQSSTIGRPKRQLAGETGLIDTYKKRVDTINEKYGTNFTWQELAQFFDSGLADKMQKFGSDVLLKAVAVIQANRKDVVNALKDAKSKTLILDVNPFSADQTVPLDPFLQRKLDELIADSGPELEKFLKRKRNNGAQTKKGSKASKKVKKSKKGKK